MKANEMVFGIRAVIEAIQADKEVDKILVKRDLQGDLSKELFEVLRGREITWSRTIVIRFLLLRWILPPVSYCSLPRSMWWG